ncbi:MULTISPECIES: hypothetical protein [Pantoea]|jgi:hypothetical protein|uniref:Adenosylhomocysteinase n=1 Tax=Pantoea brenneri TaxID=472694 RepID=A0A653UVS8_9GAMM|nr:MULTISPECIES: hypothetical protein [Pantoea]KKD34351.1 adenosylhomocysteinase [Pantoea sp. 3.5.1]MBS6035305.1 hypothetical protein [Pantoea sp.]MBZ6393477.1 hypothetical protein [Pantoea sp.]MBZ6437540.1 hypothetical protein [Pantoea sp.]MCQ5472883.1 hypothetical protein [Pantoea brenneri]
MSDDARIKHLEDEVRQLKVETTVLKEILGQQIALNNLNYKGKFDDVLAALAKEYAGRGLDEGDNRAIHDTLRQYIKYEPPSVE